MSYKPLTREQKDAKNARDRAKYKSTSGNRLTEFEKYWLTHNWGIKK